MTRCCPLNWLFVKCLVFLVPYALLNRMDISCRMALNLLSARLLETCLYCLLMASQLLQSSCSFYVILLSSTLPFSRVSLLKSSQTAIDYQFSLSLILIKNFNRFQFFLNWSDLDIWWLRKKCCQCLKTILINLWCR